MKPHIIFTGGGTAGHVIPNQALIKALQAEEWCIDYIGSKASVEQDMIKALDIPFHGISSGKLRRYFSLENFIDPFRILHGIAQAFRLLRRLKTDVVFSKGGFVAFPVVVAAWLNNIPVIAHESDFSPGLANRMSFPFVDKICITFAAGKAFFKNQQRVEVTGTPIRQELFHGTSQEGLRRCGFTEGKPCLLVMGGSQGSSRLNNVIREALVTLNQHYQVIHLCGKGKVDVSLTHHPEYCQLEYANQELPDLFAAASLVISRAGANSVYEILALQKPHVLVPLSTKVSRGDQIQNAQFFKKQGISIVLDDDTLTAVALINAVNEATTNRDEIVAKIKTLEIQSATRKIISIIKEQIHDEFPETV